MKCIGDKVQAIIDSILDNKHPLFKVIFRKWKLIVGDYYNELTDPVEIIQYKERGQQVNVLKVLVSNSAILVQLSFQQDIYLERTNYYIRDANIKIKDKVINKIKFALGG